MDVQFTNLIYNILLTLVTTATPILVGYLVVFIRQHLSAKQLETAKVIASNGVVYAQQVSAQLGLDNQAKLNSALVSVKALASKYGVKLTDDQWKNLIEPAVNEFKKGLNELGDTTNQPQVSDPTQPVLNDSTPVLENESASTTPIQEVLSVPETMMKETYDQIKAKATNDAEMAVKNVLDSVSKSIAPVG